MTSPAETRPHESLSLRVDDSIGGAPLHDAGCVTYRHELRKTYDRLHVGQAEMGHDPPAKER